MDLPPATHRRALELAKARRQSLSATLAELTALGLAKLGEPAVVTTSPVSGLPVISLGRKLSLEEVAELIDEDS